MKLSLARIAAITAALLAAAAFGYAQGAAQLPGPYMRTFSGDDVGVSVSGVIGRDSTARAQLLVRVDGRWIPVTISTGVKGVIPAQ